MKTRTGVLCVCALLFLAAQEAWGIPAFARKYNMSCTTCHQPFPRMKPYGNDYAGRGFQLPDGEPARATRETGDDMLQLMRELPLAIRFDGHLQWLPQEEGKTDFQTPYVLKLLSGGQITKHVSYYLYFMLSEQGEVAGIEDAWVMFGELFGQDLSLTVGQFQVCDPLFKRELRLTLADYDIYKVRPGHSRANLAYDRGLVATLGLPTGTDVVLQLVNGAGLSTLEGDNALDVDRFKNPSLRISQDVGEQIRVGLFGYTGKEQDESTGGLNSLWMAGADATFAFGKFELNAQYLERRDSNPDLLVNGPVGCITRGGFAELIFLPDGDASLWYGAVLYNGITSDYGDSGGEVAGPPVDMETGSLHLGYLLGRNLRLVGEYTYDFRREANALSLGFVAAF
jgi:hypothetical protein